MGAWAGLIREALMERIMGGRMVDEDKNGRWGVAVGGWMIGGRSGWNGGCEDRRADVGERMGDERG